MYKFFKFLVSVFVIFIFFLLIITTFFSNKKNSYKDFLELKSFSWTYYKQINYFDNIFTKKEDDYAIINNWKNIKVNLKNASYIFDFNDLTKKYSLDFSKIKIDFIVPGAVFVDLNNDNQKMIFSLNSILKINILSENKNYINSFYLYPHEFVILNKNNNYIKKQDDLFRIKQKNLSIFRIYRFKNRLNLNKLYFSQQISNKDSFENLIKLVWNDNLELFKEYLKYWDFIIKENETKIKEITNLKILDYPLKNLIEKYKKYLINNEKKANYLLNSIFNNLVLLYKTDIDAQNLLNQIFEDLDELKSIDIQKYAIIKEKINLLYKTILFKNRLGKNNYILDNFILLVNNRQKLNNFNYDFFILKKIYFNYDLNLLQNKEKRFYNFLQSFLKNNWIDEKLQVFKLNDKSKEKQIENFVFFLREYIDSYLFQKFDNNSLYFETKIFKDYINLSNMIYFSGKKDDIKIKTSLEEYKKLLIKIERYLRNNFFEEKRDELSNILIIKNYNINFKAIKELEWVIKNVYNLFLKNSDILTTRPDLYNSFISLSKKFNEEFLALSDYSKYKLEYNKQLQNIANIQTLGDYREKEITIEDVYKYFSKFNNLSFSLNNISKIDKYSFEIKNVVIYGKIYNLFYYPKLWNKVILKNNKDNFSYKLDEIKRVLDKKIKWVSEEEKYKYEFKNFFSEKFKPNYRNNNKLSLEEKCKLLNKVPDPNNPWKCKNRKKDDAIIENFKKYSLLGKEFKFIRDFFLVKYQDIDVEEWKQWYKISLNNVETKISIKENNIDENYSLKFNSYYDIKNHEFYNISFSVKDRDWRDLFDKEKVFYSYLRVKNNNLKQVLQEKLKEIKKINNIYSQIRIRIIPKKLKINFFYSKYVILFENNNKMIRIDVTWDKIISVKKWNIELLKEKINISDFSKILNKLF